MAPRRPRRSRASLAGAAPLSFLLALTLAACSDADRGAPGAPGDQARGPGGVPVRPGATTPPLASPRDSVERYLPLLFGEARTRDWAYVQWELVQRYFVESPDAARVLAEALTDTTVQAFVDRRLNDPFGPDADPTARGGAVRLAAALSAYVQQSFDETAFNARLGVVVGVVDVPRQNPNPIGISQPGLYSYTVPPQTFPEDTRVTVEILPADDAPLPGLPGIGPVDQPRSFPLNVHISTEPANASFQRPARLVLCTREPGDGGPASSIYSTLRVGHAFAPGQTELLPAASTADFACAFGATNGQAHRHGDAGWGIRRLASAGWRLLGPRTAWALHAGVGGRGISASPFAVALVAPSAPIDNVLTPADTSVRLSGTNPVPVFPVAAELRRADGSVVPRTGITWISLTPNVVQVSPTGVVTATGLGEGWVAARAASAGNLPVLGIARVLVTR